MKKLDCENHAFRAGPFNYTLKHLDSLDLNVQNGTYPCCFRPARQPSGITTPKGVVGGDCCPWKLFRFNLAIGALWSRRLAAGKRTIG